MFSSKTKAERTASQAWDYLSSAMSTAGDSAREVGGQTADAAAPTLRVPAAMDSTEFGQSLSDRVSYMVDNNLSSAKLSVNPPQLGPPVQPDQEHPSATPVALVHAANVWCAAAVQYEVTVVFTEHAEVVSHEQ